ncbi:hypothetical protein O3S81_05965 [Agrobacterium sp. SOY23]|uniref:hypothetical protein n=1 Tax=Agrobacterium sp. SOY23 TaxID=3014555 RepID=UPI0022AF7F26|nr:hypothetical protein [Agrobacterium sp. SOY23]MCZ4429239.1 hypothetical protein [Agrobacterium sp. SOY23]
MFNFDAGQPEAKNTTTSGMVTIRVADFRHLTLHSLKPRILWRNKVRVEQGPNACHPENWRKLWSACPSF